MTRPGSAHRWPVRVYYEDTDFSGVVYHANYLRYLERARTELLRAVGIDQSRLGWVFAVRAMSIDFKAPARMDDLLAVVSRVDAVGGASISMVQTIERDETALVTALVRLALVADGRPRRLPPDLRLRLANGPE